MVADRARTTAYARALRAQIQPGARVLEIGAGFGFFSVIAARAGAAHVDAVETNPAVHLGPKVAAANGCGDRITFHHRDVAVLALERRADLLIADLRGPTPFGPKAIDTIACARNRLLRPGGTVIARRDTLFVAATRAPAGVRQELHGARDVEGVILAPVERIVHDTPMRFSIAADDLLGEGRPWLELDYETVAGTEFSGEARCEILRAGSMEGLAVWFESDLGAGITISTEPGSGIVAYRQMFVPLRTPVDVKAGDRVRARLHVRHVGRSCLWEWQVWIRSTGAPGERPVSHQNSLAEMAIDPSAFVLTAGDVRPALGPRGRALSALLGWMDGRQTVAALAERLVEAAPGVFPTRESAAEFVAEWTHHGERLELNAE